jgi:hypothetical protein
LRTRRAWSTLLSRTNTCKDYSFHVTGSYVGHAALAAEEWAGPRSAMTIDHVPTFADATSDGLEAAQIQRGEIVHLGPHFNLRQSARRAVSHQRSTTGQAATFPPNGSRQSTSMYGIRINAAARSSLLDGRRTLRRTTSSRDQAPHETPCRPRPCGSPFGIAAGAQAVSQSSAPVSMPTIVTV